MGIEDYEVIDINVKWKTAKNRRAWSILPVFVAGFTNLSISFITCSSDLFDIQ